MESAIVLIAIVIIGAALAFVVLNMGSATTQKAKTSISSALGDASGSISVWGSIIGHSRTADDPLTTLMIPVKLAFVGEQVDLNTTRASISYLSAGVEYDNIYRDGCTLTLATHPTPTSAWTAAALAGLCVDNNPITTGPPTATTAIIYWVVAQQVPPNTTLEPGENAVLSIAWAAGDEPVSLDSIKVELKAARGATLTIERNLPYIATTIVDLN